MGRKTKVGLALVALGLFCKGWARTFGWDWDAEDMSLVPVNSPFCER